MIEIVKSGNIVFVKIGARLYLDKEGRDFAGISEPVLLANGDVGRLVFCEEIGVRALGDLEGPFDHHPVFGPVVVALQRQRSAWLHHDAFDLISITSI